MRELKKSLEQEEEGIFKHKNLVPGFWGKDAFFSSFSEPGLLKSGLKEETLWNLGDAAKWLETKRQLKYDQVLQTAC